MINLSKRFLKASMIYLFSDLLLRGASILLVPLYTRYLTPVDYGITNCVFIFTTILNGIVGLSVNGAVNRFHYEYQEGVKRGTFYGTLSIFLITWALFIAIVMDLIGPFVLDYLFVNVHFQPYLRLGVWNSFLWGIALIPSTKLLMEERPASVRLISAAYFLVSAVSTIILIVILKMGALGVLYGQLLGGIVRGILCLIFMISGTVWTLNTRYLKPALGFSIPLLGYELAGRISEFASRYLLERFTNLSQVGWYAIANAYASIGALVVASLNAAWIPLFMQIARQDDAGAVFARYGTFYFYANCGIALLLMLFGGDAIILFTTPAYYPAIKVIPVLTIAHVLGAGIWTLVHNPIFYSKKTYHLIWLTGLSGTVNCLVGIFLVKRWGMEGAACALLISQLVLVAAAYAVCSRLFPIRYDFLKMAGVTFIAGIIFTISVLTPISSVEISIVYHTVLLGLFPVMLSLLRIVPNSYYLDAWRWVQRRIAIGSQ